MSCYVKRCWSVNQRQRLHHISIFYLFNPNSKQISLDIFTDSNLTQISMLLL